MSLISKVLYVHGIFTIECSNFFEQLLQISSVPVLNVTLTGTFGQDKGLFYELVKTKMKKIGQNLAEISNLLGSKKGWFWLLRIDI